MGVVDSVGVVEMLLVVARGALVEQRSRLPGALVGQRSRLPGALVLPRRDPSCLAVGWHRCPRPCLPQLGTRSRHHRLQGRHHSRELHFPRRPGWPQTTSPPSTIGRKASVRQGFRPRNSRNRPCLPKPRRLLSNRRRMSSNRSRTSSNSTGDLAKTISSERARICARRRSERGGRACQTSRSLSACSLTT